MEPDDLKDWSLHCFCLGARSTPHRIVAADGNGRLLLAARDGIALSALDQGGFAALDSRLLLLEAYGLVERDGAQIRTGFPILGISETGLLRQVAQGLARRHEAEFVRQARAVVVDLAKAGLDGSREAVVFGHALDGVVWHHLAQASRLPDTSLSLERPYWNGAFWASFPKPAESGGTNELRTDRASLVMVWVDANASALAAIADDPATRAALEALKPGATSLVLAGQRIPVVGADLPLPAYDAIGALVAEAITQGVGELENRFGRITPEVLTVIFGHDLIWAVAEVLREHGILRRLKDIEPQEAVFVRSGG